MQSLNYADVDERMGFHPADTDLKRLTHETLRTIGIAHAKAVIDILPAGREKSLALTALQEALMWANAAVAIAGGPQAHMGVTQLNEVLADFGSDYGSGSLAHTPL